MSEIPNILKLIEAGREDEALRWLKTELPLPAAARGERSIKAALEVAKRLNEGDLESTAWFMNHKHYWLEGQTPIERAEESEEGLQFVLDMIGAIEFGVYI